MSINCIMFMDGVTLNSSFVVALISSQCLCFMPGSHTNNMSGASSSSNDLVSCKSSLQHRAAFSRDSPFFSRTLETRANWEPNSPALEAAASASTWGSGSSCQAWLCSTHSLAQVQSLSRGPNSLVHDFSLCGNQPVNQVLAISAPRSSERPKLGHDVPLVHATQYGE